MQPIVRTGNEAMVDKSDSNERLGSRASWERKCQVHDADVAPEKGSSGSSQKYRNTTLLTANMPYRLVVIEGYKRHDTVRRACLEQCRQRHYGRECPENGCPRCDDDGCPDWIEALTRRGSSRRTSTG